MTGRSRLYIIILLNLFFLSPLLANKDLKSAYIEWEPIKGAASYIVELKDESGKTLFIKRTGETRMELNIPYGSYKYRIGIMNKFYKISSWTVWYKLIIVPALKPEISRITPSSVFKSIKREVVTVKGANFLKTSKAYIRKDEHNIPVEQIEYLDPGTLSFEVDVSNAVQGKYDLVIINPGNLEKIKKECFTISIKPVEHIAKIYYHHLGIEGGYFTPPLGIQGAYSGYAGIKLFYELHSPGKFFDFLSFLNIVPDLFLGAHLSYYMFLTPEENFDTSSMVQVSFYCGYDFRINITKTFTFHLSPFIGYKHYFRWHEYDGVQYFFARPILAAGLNIIFDITDRITAGITGEYNLIFDLTPVNTAGLFLRVGYKI